jgi:heme-degrading monooxygenase HmoA
MEMRLRREPQSGIVTEPMIARVWHGVVPAEKADGYADYLAHSDLGVRAYQTIRGNRGVCLPGAPRAVVHFLLLSYWDSADAIREYTGSDMDRAQYFRYDLECLLDPEPTVSHYEVVSRVDVAAT